MFPNLACLVSPLQTTSVNTIFLQGLTGMRIRTIKKKKKRDFCKIPLWIVWLSFHLHCFALDSMERAIEHQPFNLDLSLREWIQWNLSCLNQVIPSNVELLHYKYNKNIQSYCQDVYFFLPFSVFSVLFFSWPFTKYICILPTYFSIQLQDFSWFPQDYKTIHSSVLREKIQLKG